MLALIKGFAGMICSVRLDVLCWSAVQRSMQCVPDMGIASSAAAVQVESAMTKVTNLSNCRCGFGASSAGFGRGLLPLGLD